MNEEIPYNPPGMDEYIREGARKNSELLRRMSGQPATPKTEGPKAVGSSALLGEPHLTLTLEEIRDLAQFCGMVVQEPTESEKADERETEITIAAWPKKGVWDDEQKCQVPPHKHIAYFDEYHEEGVLPLGSPNVVREPSRTHDTQQPKT